MGRASARSFAPVLVGFNLVKEETSRLRSNIASMARSSCRRSRCDLPPPGAAPQTTRGAWPVNQEIERKKGSTRKKAKKAIAGVGDARLRYTHPFPNAPVTVRASDQLRTDSAADNAKAARQSRRVLGTLNPLGWVGMGKQKPLGPEPDREWLTDPPKGLSRPGVEAAQAAGRLRTDPR